MVNDMDQNDFVEAKIVETKSTCPFASKYGHTTKSARQQFLEQQTHLDTTNVPTSVVADIDITKPLYFWRIHSLIGQEPIFSICSDFYVFVFEDNEAPWFKSVFEHTALKDHHIFAQAAYWIDAMGGG